MRKLGAVANLLSLWNITRLLFNQFWETLEDGDLSLRGWLKFLLACLALYCWMKFWVLVLVVGLDQLGVLKWFLTNA